MIRQQLQKIVKKAITQAQQAQKLTQVKIPPVFLERPREKAHGDWATNIAMVMAKQLQLRPQEIAEIICEFIEDKEGYIEKIEVAGPGFINFFLSSKYLYKILQEIEEKGELFGRSNLGQGKKVQIEFVSANPVGPMHVGHGRWAAVGDSLANILEATGYRVTREFYLNDYGRQMDIFAKSVSIRYAQLLGEDIAFPEDGYQGEYIKDIAREIIAKEGNKYLKFEAKKREEIFKEIAYRQVIEHIKNTLKQMDVNFDVWFSERTLHTSSAVKKAIKELKDRGYVFEKDGAIWFKASTFGDEKDRVLIRENGEPTYFAADVAYHKNKLERGFEKIINIWGADHHGYVARVKAAVQAFGYPAETVEILLGQLVNLLKSGEPVRMSKRTGEMVTLDELLEEVGKDALRFLLLMRSTDSPLDLDIELAVKESNENPVYYVQYAHARICSILRYAETEGVELPIPGKSDYSLLKEGPELDLIRKLAEWPEVLEVAAKHLAPYYLTRYAQELAGIFHYFYTKCRVISQNDALTSARLALVRSSQIVLKSVLQTIGVSAPERM
jgi:arginyl-tRNA synthetase